MKHFVNYRKRSIELPNGCKNLSDLLNPPKQLQAAGKGFFERMRKWKCDYCGAPAWTGCQSGMWSSDGTKNEEAHFLCEQCNEDLSAFRKRPENRLPQLPENFDFNDPTATGPIEKQIHEIWERQETFMRQKVAERKGPDHAA